MWSRNATHIPIKRYMLSNTAKQVNSLLNEADILFFDLISTKAAMLFSESPNKHITNEITPCIHQEITEYTSHSASVGSQIVLLCEIFQGIILSFISRILW